MLADNIKKYRKEKNMSQDELAEKLNVSRQSVSLWETGQTQPTIDNVIVLAKIFGISTDALLGDGQAAPAAAAATAADMGGDADIPKEVGDDGNAGGGRNDKNDKKKKALITAAVICGAAVIIALVILVAFSGCENHGQSDVTDIKTADKSALVTDTPATTVKGDAKDPATGSSKVTTAKPTSTAKPETTTAAKITTAKPETTTKPVTTAKPVTTEKKTVVNPTGDELFKYCRDFALKIGTVNGDYCMYQRSSTRYGGYDGESFSITFWNDSNMVEFCLHCPLDETLSINFYLQMRGGYNGTYEYSSSKYYRSTGNSLRLAKGTIDPSVFSSNYPLNCSYYYGDTQGQNEFMEESRVGMVDLIKLLKNFVYVENMGIDFSAFGFVNF